MSTFYAVVYGAEWEDIVYYSSFDKAKQKLVVQTRAENAINFRPFIITYTEDPTTGVYYRSKHTLTIKDITLLDDVNNQAEALDVIVIDC